MRLNVLEPNTLRALWRTAERRAGSQRKAARALGITAVHFGRLRNGVRQGQGRAISARLYGELWRFLSRRDRKRLERAVLPAAAQEVLQRYGEWLFKIRDSGVRHSRHIENELRRRYPDEWAPLDRYRKNADALDPLRYDIAVERVVWPLWEAGDAANLGMEPQWTRLEQVGRLREYVRAAVAKEVALLKSRIPDPERAKQIAARGIPD